MSSSTWPDDRIEHALAGLVQVVELGTPIALVAPASHSAWVTDAGQHSLAGHLAVALAAAAIVAIAAGMVLVVPAGRATVTNWFGVGTVRVHRTIDRPRLDPGRLIDAMTLISTADALDELGPPGDRLEQAGLGPPDAAGRPPEGGVVVVWNGAGDGAVSLWSMSIRDAFQLGKFATAGVDIEKLPQLGSTAVLIDGRHDLWTPIRTVTAERVIWWEDQRRQYRLEADLPADQLIAIAESLAS